MQQGGDKEKGEAESAQRGRNTWAFYGLLINVLSLAVPVPHTPKRARFGFDLDSSDIQLSVSLLAATALSARRNYLPTRAALSSLISTVSPTLFLFLPLSRDTARRFLSIEETRWKGTGRFFPLDSG